MCNFCSFCVWFFGKCRNWETKMPKWDSVTIYAQWLNDEADFGHTIHCRCFILSLFFRACACVYLHMHILCFLLSIRFCVSFRVQSNTVDEELDGCCFCRCGFIQSVMEVFICFFYFFETSIHIFAVGSNQMELWAGGNDGNICA